MGLASFHNNFIGRGISISSWCVLLSTYHVLKEALIHAGRKLLFQVHLLKKLKPRTLYKQKKNNRKQYEFHHKLVANNSTHGNVCGYTYLYSN